MSNKTIEGVETVEHAIMGCEWRESTGTNILNMWFDREKYFIWEVLLAMKTNAANLQSWQGAYEMLEIALFALPRRQVQLLEHFFAMDHYQQLYIEANRKNIVDISGTSTVVNWNPPSEK